MAKIRNISIYQRVYGITKTIKLLKEIACKYIENEQCFNSEAEFVFIKN